MRSASSRKPVRCAALVAFVLQLARAVPALGDGHEVTEVWDDRGRVSHVLPRQQSTISMQEETVTLVPFFDRRLSGEPLVLVNVRYTFANPGLSTRLLVGFPELVNPVQEGTSYDGPTRVKTCDFVKRVGDEWTNEVRCPASILVFTADAAGKSLPVIPRPGIGPYRRWFVFPVAFEHDRRLELRNLYVAHLSQTRFRTNQTDRSPRLAYHVEYVLHTGAGWNGPIGRADLALWDGGWRLRKILRDLRPTPKDDLRVELRVVRREDRGRPRFVWEVCNTGSAEWENLVFETSAVIQASSSRAGDAPGHPGAMVLDRDSKSAWIDGNPRGGIGEWVQIPVHALKGQVRALMVEAGAVASGTSRPKRIALGCYDREGNQHRLTKIAEQELSLADRPERQRLVLSSPLLGCDVVRVTVRELHGAPAHHATLAEVEPLE